MKKEFRIIALFLCLLMIITAAGCSAEPEAGSSDTATSSDISSEATSDDASSETTSSEAVSSEVALPESSEAPVSSATEVVSSTVTPPADPTPKPMSVTVGPYTIYDPYNTRGLSEKHRGHGHGEAASIQNQAFFDSLQNVEALTRDTKTQEKVIYLTFDCGYEYQNLTADILDTLKEKNVKAAFFCTLSYIKQNPQLVKRMIDEGHIVGNHSNTHPVFTNISRTKMAEEIYAVEKYLKENYNYYAPYFRFPTGGHSESSLELVTSMGYKSIFWSFAYVDWETANQPDPTVAFEKIKGCFYPGSVPLLHAVSRTNTTLLPQIIDYGLSQGYTFATLDDYYKE